MNFDNTCTWIISKKWPLNVRVKYPVTHPVGDSVGTRSGLGVVAREKFLLLAPIYQLTRLHILRIQYLNSRRHDNITTWIYYGVQKRRLVVPVLSHMYPVHKIPPYFCEASSLIQTNFMDVYLALSGLKMRKLLRNATVMCGGVLLVLKVPRIPLIVYLLRAEFRWR